MRGIDYNYEFLKSKTSSQNINKLLNLKKQINSSLINDNSAENHISSLENQKLKWTIDTKSGLTVF